MSDSGLDRGPFVVSAGPWRIFLLGPLLVLAGMVFLSLALVMVYVDVANPLGRLGEPRSGLRHSRSISCCSPRRLRCGSRSRLTR